MILNWSNKFSDIFTLLRSTTFTRLFNSFLIYISFTISKLFKKSFHWGKPVSISIEPTTSCNLHCVECPSGKREFTRPTGQLNMDMFKNILTQMHRKLIYITLYFQGEPYLNPNFFLFVKQARHYNIYVATSTNGHYLNVGTANKTIESGLNRLIISVDGADQETYQQYRKGGNLEKVMEGIKILVEQRNAQKSTLYVILQFIVFRFNENQIEAIKALAKELGVDELQLKTAQVYDYQKGNPLIPANTKYSRYIQKKDGDYALKKEIRNRCYRIWQSCVITWDGIVVPCCFDKDATFRMGDLKTESFADIWQNNKYTAFRNEILRDRKTIEICNNCSE